MTMVGRNRRPNVEADKQPMSPLSNNVPGPRPSRPRLALPAGRAISASPTKGSRKSRRGRFSDLRRKKPGDAIHEEIVESPVNVIGVSVAHEATRPKNGGISGWPNAEQRTLIWKGEPPLLDEVSRRRTYDMNVKLADDLGRDVTIIVGSPYIGTASEFLYGGEIKKRK